jgi:uncharacterized Zn finger protein (UPF0148 family)
MNAKSKEPISNRNGHTITKLAQKCQCGRPLFQLDDIWIYCEKCDYLEKIKVTPSEQKEEQG